MPADNARAVVRLILIMALIKPRFRSRSADDHRRVHGRERARHIGAGERAPGHGCAVRLNESSTAQPLTPAYGDLATTSYNMVAVPAATGTAPSPPARINAPPLTLAA